MRLRHILLTGTHQSSGVLGNAGTWYVGSKYCGPSDASVDLVDMDSIENLRGYDFTRHTAYADV